MLPAESVTCHLLNKENAPLLALHKRLVVSEKVVVEAQDAGTPVTVGFPERVTELTVGLLHS